MPSRKRTHHPPRPLSPPSVRERNNPFLNEVVSRLACRIRMADARLTTKQLSEILLRLEQSVAGADLIRAEVIRAMADRRRTAPRGRSVVGEPRTSPRRRR